MSMFLVNKESPAATSLMQKLCEHSKPGAIIPLTDDEMRLYRSDDFQILHIDEDGKSVIEVDPSKSYIFMVNPNNQNLNDTVGLIERLSLNAGIIRSC